MRCTEGKDHVTAGRLQRRADEIEAYIADLERTRECCALISTPALLCMKTFFLLHRWHTAARHGHPQICKSSQEIRVLNLEETQPRSPGLNRIHSRTFKLYLFAKKTTPKPPRESFTSCPNPPNPQGFVVFRKHRDFCFEGGEHALTS
jgi:hypothetical protein